MSLYTFATTNLTTAADRGRRPVVSVAMVARTLMLAALVLVAFTVMARRGAAAHPARGGVTNSRPLARLYPEPGGLALSQNLRGRAMCLAAPPRPD